MKNRRLSITVTALVFALAACGSGVESTTTAAEADNTTTTAAETTTSAIEAMSGIHAVDTDLGTILVDGEGFTLYVFTVDTEGISTCYEGCAGVWPPVPADSEIGSDLDASIFGSAPRTDGADQLTANGMPLYLYTPDANPGDTLGQGVNGVWFVVDAEGNMVGGPEAAANSTAEPIDDGYDY